MKPRQANLAAVPNHEVRREGAIAAVRFGPTKDFAYVGCSDHLVFGRSAVGLPEIDPVAGPVVLPRSVTGISLTYLHQRPLSKRSGLGGHSRALAQSTSLILGALEEWRCERCHACEAVVIQHLDVEDVIVRPQRIRVLAEIISNLSDTSSGRQSVEDEAESQVRPLPVSHEHHLEEVRGADLRMLPASIPKSLDEFVGWRIRGRSYSESRPGRLDDSMLLSPEAVQKRHLR